MTRDARITPFTIDIPQADLDDFRNRLERTRFAQDLPGVGWRYGTPTAFLQELVAYFGRTAMTGGRGRRS